MEPIRFRTGKVENLGQSRKVKIEAIGRKYPVITVVRDQSGEIRTTVLLKEARSLTFESFTGLELRDPLSYRKALYALWDHLGYEDNRVDRLIRRIQKAERLLEEAS